MKVYKRIKELRIAKGETQTKISTILGIEQSYYSKLELGKHEISLKDMIRIAEYFNVSVDYIIERTNKKEVNK
jgi:transcriptional regulator with XRE-family HTH domain